VLVTNPGGNALSAAARLHPERLRLPHRLALLRQRRVPIHGRGPEQPTLRRRVSTNLSTWTNLTSVRSPTPPAP
jgi:hypothetical protein